MQFQFESEQNIQIYIHSQNLHKLLELRTVDDAPIVCTTISPNGEYIIYSADDSIRLFKLTYEVSRTPQVVIQVVHIKKYPNPTKTQFQNNKITSVDRIKDLPGQFTACTKCLFSSNSQTIYLVKRNQTIDTFKVLVSDDTFDIDYEQTIEVNKMMKGPITHIVLSECGTYLVCADMHCNVSVWRQTNGRTWSHHINLPKYPISPVAIAIHKNSPKLVVAFADAKIFEYHLEEMQFLCAASTYFVPNQDRHAIKNITLDPRNEDIIIVHNDTHLLVLKKVMVTK